MPSKLYGVMAAGRPVLGVLEECSEARSIIEETGCGLLAEPGDYASVEKMIRVFIDMANSDIVKNVAPIERMGMKGREYLVENLTKDVSVRKYIMEILSC